MFRAAASAGWIFSYRKTIGFLCLFAGAWFLWAKEPLRRQSFTRAMAEGALYCGSAAAMRTIAQASQIAGVVSAWNPKFSKECFFLGATTDSMVRQIGLHLLQRKTVLAEDEPLSSWMRNSQRLSEIPAFSTQLQHILRFLERRWLAKANGFFPSMINWAYPCYGISVQVHPETISTYARDPGTASSITYEKRVQSWKEILPHPFSYPLILTRPCSITRYLPPSFSVARKEKMEEGVLWAEKHLEERSYAILDLTALFPPCEAVWMKTWESLRGRFSQQFEQRKIDPARILCIQNLKRGEIGGIRLLPLESVSKEKRELQHRFLIEWISHFGFAANQIELDRWPIETEQKARKGEIPAKVLSKEIWSADLKDFEKNWKAPSLEQRLMVDGDLKVLKGWIGMVSDSEWNQISRCPTRSKLAEFYFSNILEQLWQLRKKKERFFEAAAHFEQIHANVSALLEIASPFSGSAFSAIFSDRLSMVPVPLKHLLSCALHNAGMTSAAGILKAAEGTAGGPPRVIYGENSYFENILTAKEVSRSCSVEEAAEEDWKEVDLLMLQFNPALRRTFMEATEYRVEPIEAILRKTLAARKTQKPLTAAIDCTFDYIHSRKVGALLETFQNEIEEGILNLICYRSGLKFDLFGMDNFCGAPFFQIHSRDPKWAAFDALLSDPALQTDRLSLNWFCLAYRFAADELDLYRKRIFDNTRSLLDRLPPQIFEKGTYRIVPIEKAAEAGFLDIKVFGSFHNFKGSGLICGPIVNDCLLAGHPIFYRRSVGFYHPNISILFGKENATIRLTLGLDPEQVDCLAESFYKISLLNN